MGDTLCGKGEQVLNNGNLMGGCQEKKLGVVGWLERRWRRVMARHTMRRTKQKQGDITGNS